MDRQSRSSENNKDKNDRTSPVNEQGEHQTTTTS